MKSILVFGFFLISPICWGEGDFKGVEVTDESSTEAGLNDPLQSGEFCCDREHTGGWAQEMSPQESQKIVRQVLNTVPRPATRPSTRKRGTGPSSGQR